MSAWFLNRFRLSRRQRLPELMDAPELPAPQHRQALDGLRRINQWSRSVRIVWAPIWALARQHRVRALRILDVATGGGDVPMEVWRAARRAGLSLEIAGCDRSPTAVRYARERAAQLNARVTFFELDVLSDPLPSGYDVLMCSLFLHHLDEDDAVEVLGRMRQAAGELVVVNDLVRSVSGLALAYLGTRLLSASDVVHVDGPRSVRGAYTIEEARTLAQQAGLEGATVSRRWPCRFVVAWRRA